MVRKLFALIMVSTLLLGGCKKADTEVPKLQDPVGANMDTALVARGDIYSLKTYDAKIYPDTQEVSSMIDGNMKDIAVYLGQEVKKGELLVSLDDEDLNTQLTKLEDTLNDARTENEYSNKLKDLDIQLVKFNILQKKQENAPAIDIAKLEADLSKQEQEKQQTLELQKFNMENTQKKINEIKSELEKYKIVAPCSGKIVFIKYVNNGARLSAYDTVVIIAEGTKLHVQSNIISQSEINNASQVYAMIKGKEYDIKYIPLDTEELLQMKNNGAEIESRFSINADTDVTAGDSATICIKSNLQENVIIIPKNALYKDSEGSFVYRLEDGKSKRCDVEIGTETDIQVEIKSGLAEGDVIYVQGL